MDWIRLPEKDKVYTVFGKTDLGVMRQGQAKWKGWGWSMVNQQDLDKMVEITHYIQILDPED